MRGLDGKVALIAGAAPGNIGAATARRLGSEGAVVVVADLNGDAATSLAAQLTDEGIHARPAQFDISSAESVQAMVDATIDDLGSIDVLFNVAADLSPAAIGVDSSHDVISLPIDVWRHTIDVTLTGYMLTTKAVLPQMIEAGGGAIVNTMSAAVWMAEPVRAAYASAKAGLAALTRHTATIAGRSGVRCNAIAPGTVLTEALRRTLPEAEQQRQLAEISSTRLGAPEDVAAAVAFLVSDDGLWINGQTIAIDGGLTKQ